MSDDMYVIMLRMNEMILSQARTDYHNRRKGVSDKAQEKLTPESEKSVLDKAKEGTTNVTDSVAGAVQPGMFPTRSRVL